MKNEDSEVGWLPDVGDCEPDQLLVQELIIAPRAELVIRSQAEKAHDRDTGDRAELSGTLLPREHDFLRSDCAWAEQARCIVRDDPFAPKDRLRPCEIYADVVDFDVFVNREPRDLPTDGPAAPIAGVGLASERRTSPG